MDAHLATCGDCARWFDDAVAVTRLVRLSAGEPPSGRNLAPEALADLAPGPALRRLAVVLRWLLGALGFLQFMLGIAQVSPTTSSEHAHSAGTGLAHLGHESAAWNIAIGAGFAWIALRRSRPATLIPILTAFVAMLGLLSINDAWIGTVDAGRLLSHGFVFAGYAIVVALSRPRLDFGDPPDVRRPRPRWPVGGPDLAEADLAPAQPPLRLVTRARSAPVVRSDHAA